MEHGDFIVAVKHCCIKCGRMWGEGEDYDSHGVCPHCFAEWAIKRQQKKNLKDCFGQYEQTKDVDCKSCSLKKFCKEYYGIK